MHSNALINRSCRTLLAAAGLAICSVGTYFQLEASIGLAPWNALNLGISLTFPLTYGQATAIVSVLVLLADYRMHERIGIGTLLDAFLVGWGVDILTGFGFSFPKDHLPTQILLLLAGMAVIAVGQAVYMRAGLGCGPRDALVVALGKRSSRFSVGTVNLIVFSLVLFLSVLFHSPIGIGTLLGTFCTGFVMDIVFRLLRFDPCMIQHEDLLETLRAITNRSITKN